MSKFKIYAEIKTTKYIGEFEEETKEQARQKGFKEACLYLHDKSSEIDGLVVEEVKAD